MERLITVYKSPGEGIGISMDTTPDRGHVSTKLNAAAHLSTAIIGNIGGPRA